MTVDNDVQYRTILSTVRFVFILFSRKYLTVRLPVKCTGTKFGKLIKYWNLQRGNDLRVRTYYPMKKRKLQLWHVLFLTFCPNVFAKMFLWTWLPYHGIMILLEIVLLLLFVIGHVIVLTFCPNVFAQNISLGNAYCI